MESAPDPVDSELPTKEEWTCDRDVAGFPWEEVGFWEKAGPYSALVLPTDVPTTPHWQLRMARKTGERSWEADPRVLAIHVSSFGILPAEDGLLLSVSVDALPAEAMGVQVPITRELVVFATQDLENWSTHLYRLMVEEEVLPTDQSLWLDAGGALHAVYYRFLRVEGQNSGIPAGPHPIATAAWKSGCFEVESVVYTADNLLDPVICPYPDGQGWWLFATTAELQIEDEKATDRAEIKLMEAVENGEIAAIIFRLKTKAKKRGYVERQELTGADNQPIITISSNL